MVDMYLYGLTALMKNGKITTTREIVNFVPLDKLNKFSGKQYSNREEFLTDFFSGITPTEEDYKSLAQLVPETAMVDALKCFGPPDTGYEEDDDGCDEDEDEDDAFATILRYMCDGGAQTVLGIVKHIPLETLNEEYSPDQEYESHEDFVEQFYRYSLPSFSCYTRLAGLLSDEALESLTQN